MSRSRWVIIAAVILGIFFAGNIFAEEGGLLKIAALKGKVLIKKAGTEEWVEPKVGDLLNMGDSIKTLEDGSVYLEIGPNNGFTLGPNSEFVMGNTIAQPVAEPYTEPARDSIDNVVAPEVNQESAASRI